MKSQGEQAHLPLTGLLQPTYISAYMPSCFLCRLTNSAEFKQHVAKFESSRAGFKARRKLAGRLLQFCLAAGLIGGLLYATGDQLGLGDKVTKITEWCQPHFSAAKNSTAGIYQTVAHTAARLPLVPLDRQPAADEIPVTHPQPPAPDDESTQLAELLTAVQVRQQPPYPYPLWPLTDSTPYLCVQEEVKWVKLERDAMKIERDELRVLRDVQQKDAEYTQAQLQAAQDELSEVRDRAASPEEQPQNDADTDALYDAYAEEIPADAWLWLAITAAIFLMATALLVRGWLRQARDASPVALVSSICLPPPNIVPCVGFTCSPISPHSPACLRLQVGHLQEKLQGLEAALRDEQAGSQDLSAALKDVRAQLETQANFLNASMF